MFLLSRLQRCRRHIGLDGDAPQLKPGLFHQMIDAANFMTFQPLNGLPPLDRLPMGIRQS